jgi:hypothetical protein
MALMTDTLNEAKCEMLFYGNVKYVFDLVDVDFHQSWSIHRSKKGISSRLLLFKDSSFDWFVTNAKDHLREFKYLPENHFCKGSFYIYNDTIISWDPIMPKAVKITDKTLAETYLSLFNTLWDQL